jgi:Protein of unknown function DUF262
MDSLAVEQRYAREDRGISQERLDFLLPQIIDFVQTKKWMNLQPEYQRRQVWDKKKQSLFIESLLMNLPIPPVFLFEPEYNRYEVMDGQQRLSAIVALYENKLKLTGLESWSELNGKTWLELPEVIRRGLDRRRMSAVVLRGNQTEQDEELRRIVFERLNTGGQKLNAQELRNCIFSGSFAGLIERLAGFTPFNDLWEIPRYEDHYRNDRVDASLAENSTFKRMQDCELVLRFFALRNRKNIKGSMKSILDDFMEANRNPDESVLDEMAEAFESRILLAQELLGPDAFKLRGKLSVPYYDSVILACDREYPNSDTLLAEGAQLKSKLAKMAAVEKNHDLITGKANTSEAIKSRLDLVHGVFASVL